ncbi:MAG: AMP-binding protein [Pseudonocardiales bacterium]|nr:AMP-binding protein [Pseudonocardiales bacterium]
MSLSQLVDRAAAVSAVLAELDVHRNEPVLITLPEGPGFIESFAGAVDHEALPLPAGPLLSASELAAAAAAARARVVLASPDQLPTWAEVDTEPAILINGPHGPWIAALRLR